MEKNEIKSLKELLEKAQAIVDSGKLPFMVVTSPESGNRYVVFPKKNPELQEAKAGPFSGMTRKTP